MLKNQKGFSAVMVVLVLVIVGLIGTIGWLVYQKGQDTKPQSSASTEKEQSADTPDNSDNEVVKQENIIKLPELGIQITVPDSIKDLQYFIEKQTDYRGQEVVYARLSTKTIAAQDSNCNAESSAIGVIAKGLGVFPPEDDQRYMYYGDLSKQFSGFFITYSKSQNPCASGDDEAHLTNMANLQQEYSTAVASSMPSIAQLK